MNLNTPWPTSKSGHEDISLRVKKLGRKFRVGDLVTVVEIPSDLTDAAGIGTPMVFKRARGKIFRVEGFGKYGHIELKVTKRDTIWIEPEFVAAAGKPRQKQ